MHGDDLARSEGESTVRVQVRRAVYLFSALSIVVIALVEGFHFFLVWNAAPILVAMFLLTTSSRFRFWPAIALYVVTVGVSLSYHGLYFFDVNGIATESSTSGLIFVFLPVLALASGASAGGTTWALKRPES